MLTQRFQLLGNVDMIYIFIISNEVPGLPLKMKHLICHCIQYPTQIVFFVIASAQNNNTSIKQSQATKSLR